MSSIRETVSKVVGMIPAPDKDLVVPICQQCGVSGNPRVKTEIVPKLCRRCREFASGLETRITEAGVPSRFSQARLEDLPIGVRTAMLRWGASDGLSVLLHGPTGTSKSHAAAAALRAILERESGALWAFVPTACLTIRRLGERADDLIDSLLRVPWLVLDDLGAERSTDFILETLSCVVMARWDHELPTLVTSNASPSELSHIHPRMGSRLSSGIVIEMSGVDRRLQ